MNQKILSFMIALCLLLGLLAGCGGQQTDTTVTFPDFPTIGQAGASTNGVVADEDLKLNRDDITLIKAGETLNLYDGSIPVAEITWSSHDTAVATFENGIVTAVGKGDTTVYAEYNGVKVSCKVYCNLKQDTASTTPADSTKPTQPTLSTQPTQPSSGGTATGPREPVLPAPTQEVVGASFFDDAVFVGDSISLRLSYYATDKENGYPLGNAKFLVRVSYGVFNEVTGAFYLTYQGEEMKLTDALAKIGAKKVFIMLGLNDIGLYGIDKTIEKWGELLSSVREKNPDVQIYIQSMTPIWTGGEKGGHNNPNVNAYNEKLEAFARNNGCKYIDVASYMRDSTGGLATRFCADSFLHLTNEGVIAWIKVLKAYTGY